MYTLKIPHEGRKVTVRRAALLCVNTRQSANSQDKSLQTAARSCVRNFCPYLFATFHGSWSFRRFPYKPSDCMIWAWAAGTMWRRGSLDSSGPTQIFFFFFFIFSPPFFPLCIWLLDFHWLLSTQASLLRRCFPEGSSDLKFWSSGAWFVSLSRHLKFTGDDFIRTQAKCVSIRVPFKGFAMPALQEPAWKLEMVQWCSMCMLHMGDCAVQFYSIAFMIKKWNEVDKWQASGWLWIENIAVKYCDVVACHSTMPWPLGHSSWYSL